MAVRVQPLHDYILARRFEEKETKVPESLLRKASGSPWT
jgi:hypothetical protein